MKKIWAFLTDTRPLSPAGWVAMVGGAVVMAFYVYKGLTQGWSS